MLTNFAILNLSTADLLIILVVVMLLFGAKKLPELSKSIGSSLQELRKGLSGDVDTKQKDKQKEHHQNDQQQQ